MGAERAIACHTIPSCSDICYSEFCHSSRDVFGCIGLKNAQYCILNKQYSKEEYQSIRAEIIESMKIRGEWGEFFPCELSPFAYNESIVHEYLPLPADEISKRGLRLVEKKTLCAPEEAKVPPEHPDLSELDIGQIYKCSQTGRAFRLQKAEVELCRRLQIPLPSKAPDTRHEARMSIRAPRNLSYSDCIACGKEVTSAYASMDQSKLFCLDCYQNKVF